MAAAIPFLTSWLKISGKLRINIKAFGIDCGTLVRHSRQVLQLIYQAYLFAYASLICRDKITKFERNPLTKPSYFI